MDDIKDQVAVGEEDKLQLCLKDIETKYGCHPSLYGEPADVFKGILKDIKCAINSKLTNDDQDGVFHLGAPRAAVHYWNALETVAAEDSSTGRRLAS